MMCCLWRNKDNNIRHLVKHIQASSNMPTCRIELSLQIRLRHSDNVTMRFIVLVVDATDRHCFEIPSGYFKLNSL